MLVADVQGGRHLATQHCENQPGRSLSMYEMSQWGIPQKAPLPLAINFIGCDARTD
jgi:hypothetical protein